MELTEKDLPALIESYAQEVARLTHRALIAETLFSKSEERVRVLETQATELSQPIEPIVE